MSLFLFAVFFCWFLYGVWAFLRYAKKKLLPKLRIDVNEMVDEHNAIEKKLDAMKSDTIIESFRNSQK